MAEKNKLFIIICLICNIALSLVIVVLNKWIYTQYHFPNMTMTCIHFVFSTLGIVFCQFAGIFQNKSLPIIQMIPLSLTFCGFVVFTNLSLQNNTVGTYQLAKAMTTPCIIGIQTYSYKKTFSTPVKISLVIIIMFTNLAFVIKFIDILLFQFSLMEEDFLNYRRYCCLFLFRAQRKIMHYFTCKFGQIRVTCL